MTKNLSNIKDLYIVNIPQKTRRFVSIQLPTTTLADIDAIAAETGSTRAGTARSLILAALRARAAGTR